MALCCPNAPLIVTKKSPCRPKLSQSHPKVIAKLSWSIAKKYFKIVSKLSLNCLKQSKNCPRIIIIIIRILKDKDLQSIALEFGQSESELQEVKPRDKTWVLMIEEEKEKGTCVEIFLKPLTPEDSPFFEQLEETQTLKMHISFLKIWNHDQAHIMKICEIQFWMIHLPKRQNNNFPCQMISICNKIRYLNFEQNEYGNKIYFGALCTNVLRC